MKRQKVIRVLSPDGFDIARDEIYATMEEAEAALLEWVKRYDQQGYYSNSNRERIPCKDIIYHCNIIQSRA